MHLWHVKSPEVCRILTVAAGLRRGDQKLQDFYLVEGFMNGSTEGYRRMASTMEAACRIFLIDVGGGDECWH